MSLYNIPNNTKVRLKSTETSPPASIDPQVEEVYTFHHIDGMYSYCKDSSGNVIHLPAWSEIEVVT
jgi:hypothetical protein